MSSLVPEGWSQIKIADIGSFFGGLTGKTAKDFGEGHPFLTYMQVYLQQTSDMEAMNSVRIDEDEKQNAVAYGDILFTTSSETPDEIGMTDVFLQSNHTPYLNSFCFGLRPITPSPIDPTFGKYVFRGDDFREDMRPLAQGSTRFNLSKGNLAKLSLLVPPLPEQKKIASILTSVDEVIENTQKQIDKLQDLKKATMNELLTKGIGHTEFKDSELGRIPKSWEVVYLKKLVFVDVDSLKTNTDSNYSFKYIDISCVSTGKVSLPANEIAFKDAPSRARKIVKCNDVLIATVRPNLKAFAHFDEEGENWVASTGFAILRHKENCDSKFIYNFMLSDIVTRQIDALIVGSNYPAINTKDIKELTVLAPPLSEQQKIASILSSIDKRISQKSSKLHQTQSLKKSLMQDLLTGKVRVMVN